MIGGIIMPRKYQKAKDLLPQIKEMIGTVNIPREIERLDRANCAL